MVDFVSMAGALQGANATVQIVKAAVEGRDHAKAQAAIAETQAQLLTVNSMALALQQQQFVLAQDKEALLSEVKRLKDWTQEKARYVLTDAGNGVLVYRVEETMRGSEPTHDLCPTCFQEGVKSILQPESRVPRARVLVCIVCGADLYLDGSRHAEHSKAARRR